MREKENYKGGDKTQNQRIPKIKIEENCETFKSGIARKKKRISCGIFVK